MSDNGDEDYPYRDNLRASRALFIWSWWGALIWGIAIVLFLAGCADGETFAFRGGQLLQLLKGVP